MDKIKQKLYGIALIAIGILSVLPDKDATAALLIVPMGIYMVFTKEKVTY